ncbi:universal stress protein [Streptomyces sp. NPDC052225]|uniref:universal stress protein n=1 Tax=Streptomyces sp. NPDC052225 TaxID=3154949 RepID=UPI003412669E
MIRPVTVGLDGSPESLAAAEWAAREAVRHSLPLRLVQAWAWQPHDIPAAQDPETRRHWAQRILREAEQHLLALHPRLTVSTEQVASDAREVLLDRAETSEMLVLGSSGHGAVAGFLLGSVAQQVLAHAHTPVVLVRPHARPDAVPDGAEVVVGLSRLDRSAGRLLEFAFAEADARTAALRVVHVPAPAQPRHETGDGLTAAEKALIDLLAPWQDSHPQVPVALTVELGHGAGVLLRATRDAGLVVVGRRLHRPALGPRIGSVTHAMLHHAAAPVAVVPQP